MKKQYLSLLLLLLVSMLDTTTRLLTAQTCSLGTTGLLPNIRQTVSSGTASNFQPGRNIELSFDNNPSTTYHSSFNNTVFPITLDYHFSGTDRIDYMIYVPRTTGENGLFIETELWYSTTAAPAVFTKIRDFNFNAPATPVIVSLSSPISNPATFRIIVKSGKNNLATCAEMEFYKFGSTIPAIFKDNICSGLLPGATQADINALSDGFFKNLAQCLFDNNYDTAYRIQQYEPYQSLPVLRSELKTSNNYSKLENPTGIFLQPGTAVVLVEDNFDEPLSLRQYFYRGNTNIKQKDYPLMKGINLVPVDDTGLAYINYYTTNFKTAPPVRIHITAGEINGYFDVTKDNNTQWNSLLQNTVTPMLDIKGRKTGLLYPKPSLLLYSPNNGVELVTMYDSMVHLEHEIMGLYPYNKVPKNHMFAAAYDQAAWAWHAGGEGVNFGSAVQATCEYADIRNNMWGIAHEYGHINQITPGLKWVGLSETTNNIYAAWIAYRLGTTPLARKRLEGETVNDAFLTPQETGTPNGQGTTMVGGRFNAYLNNGIRKQQKWQCQYGPMNRRTAPTPDEDHTPGGDLFVRLMPLWQLQLNYQVAAIPPKNWHADVAEKVRNTNETNLSNGALRLNFMKNLVDAVQEDLTEYIKKVGILRTLNQLINDYTPAQMLITAQDSIDMVNYIQSKHYPKPASPVLYYISANSVDAFATKAAVIGTFNTGVTAATGTGIERQVTVDHAIWKNVVVFETYTGNTLNAISMVGSGFIGNDQTRVYYPDNSTAVYAVGWNGKKTLVLGTANVAPLVSRVSNIQSSGFSLVVETLTAGNTYDVSLDGGATWTLLNQTADSIAVSGLATNTSYRLITRRNSGSAAVTGDLTIVTTSDSPLPIILKSFTATVTGCNQVVLQWVLDDAAGFSHFEAEQSTDGLSYQAIMRTSFDPAKTTGTYTTGNLPTGKYYYRLKMVDIDGSSKYSQVVPVTVNCKGRLLVYPNPARAICVIESPDAISRIAVYNPEGRKVQLIDNLNSNRYTLDVSKWINGMYFLQISSPAGIQEVKLFKSK